MFNNSKENQEKKFKPFGMESFIGYVQTVKDALLLFEAVRSNNLKCIERRLNVAERNNIKSGATFIFDEQQSGLQRWTDGYSWSTSRVKGHFLVYEQKNQMDPLFKKTISVVTRDNKKYCLVNYYYGRDLDSNSLVTPKDLQRFQSYSIPAGFYFKFSSSLKDGAKSFKLTPLSANDDSDVYTKEAVKRPNPFDLLFNHDNTTTTTSSSTSTLHHFPTTSVPQINYENTYHDTNTYNSYPTSSSSMKLPGIQSLLLRSDYN